MHIEQSVLNRIAANIKATGFPSTAAVIVQSNSQFYLNQDTVFVSYNENIHWIKGFDIFVWYGSA